MQSMTRRNVVLSAAAAGAAFGLNGSLEIISPASAQDKVEPSALNPKALKFHKFKVGDIEVTQVLDGTLVRDHNPAFIKNASVDDVKAALKAAGLPDDKVPNAYTITIVKVGDRQVMFDSGNGLAAGNAGIRPSRRQREGSRHRPVQADRHRRYALPSRPHLRPVHQGERAGLRQRRDHHAGDGIQILDGPRRDRAAGRGAPGHCQARAGVDRVLEEHQASGGRQGRPARHSYRRDAGAYAGPHQLSGQLRQQPAARARRRDQHPGHQLRNPGWHVMFDQDAPTAEATRRKTMDRIIADKITATGYHWGMPGAGTIAKDGNGYALSLVSV